MKLVVSLNNKESLYEYTSMNIDTYVLGCPYSFYTPCIFSLEDIQQFVKQYPHHHYYIAINALYDEHVIGDVESYIDELASIGVYGILFQDFGVLQIVKNKGYTFDMMYSPETLNTNARTLNTLQQLGVSSAFLSKVIPLEEQINICDEVHMPLMLQGHGVEYIAASKRHLLSNYQEASQKSFQTSMDAHLTIQAKQSDYAMYIYEDSKGTHVFSKTRLYTLDLFHHIQNFDYLYIETLYMDYQEAIEVVSLYHDALDSLYNGTYDKYIQSYMTLLDKLQTPLDRGFLFDQTVYKLEDVRKMENEKNESNH